MCDTSSVPQNLISAITVKEMLRKGCQGYLTLVRDITAKKTSISDVPVACEFPDELSGLPPHREIEFCIDVVSDTTHIFVLLYSITPAELSELNK